MPATKKFLFRKNFWRGGILCLSILLLSCGNKGSKVSTEEKVNHLASQIADKPIDWIPEVNGPTPNTLVKKGEKPVSIIVYPDAPPRTKACAIELADYIEKISGARPEVLMGEPAKTPEKAIWIGIQPAVIELFPDVDLTFQYPEEILIHSNEKHLLIAGRDRWIAGKMIMQGRKNQIEDVQQEYGTCNAIYTFLQKYLGVRWLGPGVLWEDFSFTPNLAIPKIHYRYHPQLRSRDGVLRLMVLGDDRSTLEEKDWTRRQRLLYSSLMIVGNHAFTDWWEKYHTTHPEYFALLPNGKREPLDDPGKVKLCMSNPAVWKQWMEEVRFALQKNPSQQVFNASPNDGWNRGHCTCAICQAWDVVLITDPDPNLADRDLRFANELARLLKLEYPEKDYYVQLHAYGYSSKLPIRTKVDDQVIISSVHGFFISDKSKLQEYQEAKQQFIGWSKIAKNMVWRLNLPNYAGNPQGMPDIALQQSYKDVQFAAVQGIKGIWVDTYLGHWSTQLPQYYLLSQIIWDPSLDYENTMNNFYSRAYKEAKNEMKDYWESMEKTRSELIATYPEYSYFMMHRVYDEDWVNKAKEKLVKALNLVKGDQQVTQRIQFHQFGLEIVELMLELRRLQSRLKEAKDVEKLKIQMDAIWDKAQNKLKVAPTNAFNTKFVLPENPEAGKTQSMHYSFEPKKKIKRAIDKYKE